MQQIEMIQEVIDYIEAHLNEKLTLTNIATAIGYSKYHLHRKFMETVGLSIHDYVQRRQLSEAAKLLVFSQQSILDIALLAGYESQQAFTTIFKQMYKKTPKEYRQAEVYYPLQLHFVIKSIKQEDPSMEALQAKIRLAKEADIPVWMELVSLVIDGFPNLDEAHYRKVLQTSITNNQAWILTESNHALAIMIFDPHTGNIAFFGVHPLYRQGNIAKGFLNKVIKELIKQPAISITTFREGDKADTGYRKLYQSLGFAEAELLVEFGYPTQKFILSTQGDQPND